MCGCVSCHVWHRPGSDGGWFSWYAEIQREIIIAVAGPTLYGEQCVHGRMVIHDESLEPHPKLQYSKLVHHSMLRKHVDS